MKVDGRRLRKDIKDYVSKVYPDRNPDFTVRSIKNKEWNYKGDNYILEVRFSEIDPDACAIWSDVADYITNWWWKANKGKATMAIKVWDGLYRPQTTKEVKIDRVDVGLYGWMHE